MLPPAIGLLSSILKNNGFDVRLFDTTYYESLDDPSAEEDSDQSKVDKLMARPFKMPQEITLKTTNVFEDFKEEVETYNPDLIAVSATEDMFLLGVKLLKALGNKRPLTILGGVFATFASELALSYPEIDMVCRGEGEDAFLQLCQKLSNKEDYSQINNLWIKQKDGAIKCNPVKMVDIDSNPLIDTSIFEEARYYRPMAGEVYRMFPVETNRGCPFMCTYCNSPAQNEMYKAEEGRPFLRKKSLEKVKEELLFYKNEMKAEYLYFWADTFFSWKGSEFDEFAEMYKDINLPFWCQTRIETVKLENFKKLKEIGCARVSFGIEHGNEKFRQKILKRMVTNETMINNFKIVDEVGIPYSVNNIIGFPGETYELAFDTIRINKLINAVDRNAYQFTPFHGTNLRRECEELGYIKDEDIAQSLVVGKPLLDMPQFSKEKVMGLVKTFNLYVGFPESRWPAIQKAEEDTKEGNQIYNELKEEFVEKYF
jgi:radical SAM superfamily enzyme YgiQ (UPF0313 family)